MDYLSGLWGGGKEKAAGVGQTLRNANNAVKPANLLKVARPIAGSTALLSILAAAGELADEDDPLLRNATQAVTNAGGGLAGAGTGFVLGNMIFPGVGGLIGAGLGGYYGSQAGSNAGGGIYDLLTGDNPMKRKLRQDNQVFMQKLEQEKLQAQQNQALTAQAMEIERADAFARAERDLQIANEYNFANSLNQQVLMRQQANTLQNLAMQQYMAS